ncbi:immunoglobulin-like domain-containing protein [Haloechinothrix halophila]|uniref:immunoglobulin-like domain-containing protein n=1 Tax=Haloechinothrix halophila TaxID=1069073 RepID=UPI0012FBD34A|nr:immunoglobulin-like domain-containing protein [Haloechinothrix halophila]
MTRRLRVAMSVALAVVVVAACADDGPADKPPLRSDTSATSHVPRHVVRGDVTRLHTPQGEAAIQLVLDKRSMEAGEQLAVRLVNRGDVEVMTGLPIIQERWNGERWVEITQHGVWPDVGILLQPGGSTEAQTWPFGGLPEPGRYRLTKSASYEGGDVDRRLVAAAMVEVH